ncbi:MAG: hypothetical protein KC621_13320, partial [Myxococcales bacterium]|nr:hypothetical protein [Myxococcales bacterium]
PAPAPEPELPPLDVQGLWFGTTGDGGLFKLEVLGQTEGSFEGLVQVSAPDGSMQDLAVGGTVDGKGAISFRGGGAKFSGKVSGSHASGSFTLADGAKGTWSGDK